jgi:hypothetical protein
MATTATTAGISINSPVNYTSSTINMGTGNLATDNIGNLTWNGNPLACSNYVKSSVNRVSDMLKDSITREIILCKTREECQQKYGEYGLKFFDAMLNEVLQEAIKSEEAFLSQLQEEKDKFEKFKQAVIEELGIDSIKLQSFLISSYNLQ